MPHNSCAKSFACLQPVIMLLYLVCVCLVLSVIPGTNGGCPLKSYAYSGTQFSDAYGRESAARVEESFVTYMNDMNGYAKSCGVQIKVTSHFRKAPVTGNAWNAMRSCHMIGHAIDMNLLGKKGFCNSVCLKGYSGYNGPDSSINCFLKKIRYEHPKLHWGIDFNDPVHIDDRLCTNTAAYDKLFAALKDC